MLSYQIGAVIDNHPSTPTPKAKNNKQNNKVPVEKIQLRS